MATFADSGSYDQALTVFSPDGQQYQIEYALEVVNRGATVLGIACPEGVMLVADTRPFSPLQTPTQHGSSFKSMTTSASPFQD